MGEDSNARQDASANRQHAQQRAAKVTGLDQVPSPVEELAYPTSLLSNPALQTTRNLPVRLAVMRKAQQTYGNRALRQMLQMKPGPGPDRSTPVAEAEREADSADPVVAASGGITPGCGCGLCQGGTGYAAPVQRSVSLATTVIQRKKLGASGARQVEEQLQDLMSNFASDTIQYEAANTLFEHIDAETQDHEALRLLADAANITGVNDFQDISQSITVGGMRLNYYPSGFNATARNNRDNYVAHHPGTAANTWRCPGYGVPPHNASTNDVTIDHVTPVAQHWNTVGYKSDKQTRNQWYNDVTNHVILCRSCNSRKGSGNVTYNKQPDVNAGFSH